MLGASDLIEIGQVREVSRFGLMACPRPYHYTILNPGTRLIVAKFGHEVYYDLNPHYSLQRSQGEMAVRITTIDGHHYEVSSINLVNETQPL